MSGFHIPTHFKFVALISAAFAVPYAVLSYLYFSEVSSPATLTVVGMAAAGFAVSVIGMRCVLHLIRELKSKLAGIHSTRAVIEFDMDGTIIWANKMYLDLFGYRIDQLKGRHHRDFIDEAFARSKEYQDFWAKLRRGESTKLRRTQKDAKGNQIWITTHYTPVLDEFGRAKKVVNWVTNHTESRREQDRIIATIGGGLKKLASGDLSARLDTALDGEYDALRNDFNTAMERLQSAIKAALESTGVINDGAGEISRAADDLSRRTEQQAASLEETAAALEEITATVKKTAANAREASTGVSAAKTAAEEGGQVVQTAIRAMDSIAQSSKQITDIIGVIDEIAFQTNLLALNAGVEAARAGEAGKGFAVVASEVRALAQRSSGAAKEIKGLINTSSEHVSDGVKFVGESGEALRRIVEQVVHVNALVSEMAQATEQQSIGIEQVNVAVSQMDQVTQQNAAMVEKSTAATRHLVAETQSLASAVGFFSMAREARLAAPKARAAEQRAA